MDTFLDKKLSVTLGTSVALAVALFGLAGCSSPAPTSAQGAAAAPSSVADDDDDDADMSDDEFDAYAEKIGETNASSFDTAQAVVTAFVDAGGVCNDQNDSGLSLATSSIDCTGPSGQMQTIAVFATPAEAKSWFDAQTAVKVGEVTSYLLGENWAMVAEGSSMNVAQKLGVRMQSIVMH